MMVSPFTPLFFIDRKTDGVACEYVQTFATTDQILIELIGENDWGGGARVIDGFTEEPLFEITLNIRVINEETTLRFATLSLSPGVYSVEIDGIGKSQSVKITDNVKELAKTTLIQYSMHNNRQREDAIFFIDNMQYFFDFRVPGGFKESNWSFSVENEQFVTDKADVMQLYALESTQHKFTLGTSQGCPVWFAEMLNRILCCTYVYFDGVRYARKESGVPELAVQLEGVNSFVFTQNLQWVAYIDPFIEAKNNFILRRVNTAEYRAINEGVNRKI